jgi:RNA-binding motif X-linked protein 2
MTHLHRRKATKREIELGLSESASWHAEFKHSAYVFIGGLDFALTEGDVLAVFSQYGEIVDLNLVRDKTTGKPRGFAFVAYEDQRSTNLAVDNLSGAKVAGRIVRVEHVSNYKKKKAEVRDRGEGVGGRARGHASAHASSMRPCGLISMHHMHADGWRAHPRVG